MNAWRACLAFLLAAVAALAAVAMLACSPPAAAPATESPSSAGQPRPVGRPSPASQLQEATVTHVVDGDTIVAIVDGREERIRYIGIDAPEVSDSPEPFGADARDANAELVAGQTVGLERDASDTDRFGRLLRYVWLPPPTDGGPWRMVNAELVRRGFAHARTYPPDVKHQDALRAAEREARDSGAGLWSQP